MVLLFPVLKDVVYTLCYLMLRKWSSNTIWLLMNEWILQVWTPDLKLLAEFQAHDCPIYHMASEGSNFYTCSNDTTIKEWTHNGKEWVLARVLEGHKQPVRRLRVNGGCLYSGDEAGEVRSVYLLIASAFKNFQSYSVYFISLHCLPFI